MPRRLLFVCSGNITRSPMAAALADLVAMELSLDVEIASAGTLGLIGHPAHPQMVAAARARGLDLSNHRSQALTAELCRWADRIAVMEPHHAMAVASTDPGCADKVVHLGPLVGVPEVTDPTGSWFFGPYQATRDLLETAVRRFVASDKQLVEA